MSPEAEHGAQGNDAGRILVVEDEEQIAEFVRSGLIERGFQVETCGDGETGLEKIRAGGFDAIVLDIMLPGLDGLSVVDEMRREENATPVILLTARNALDDRVRGLEGGADDYLVKPFFVEELAARLHALIRRASGSKSAVELTVEGLTLDRVERTANCGGNKVTLTSREYELLAFLMRSPGDVYTRAQIHEGVWEYHFDPKTNIVDVYIQRLRARIEEAGGDPTIIETVRGVGYRIRPAKEA